ncbi:MAG: tRNA (adenosine(37)-N6)-dimethylallyltransferase MiaA [Thermodesulfobacteriota bacterium]|nr:tRNA (adenosine(37)-N6)-dimethylallyltransferase MiaA [Thermodesulfobacteriota bacterium]
MPQKPAVIIISGPTCVGKTEAAISLAEPLAGEIISADAMQVYRYMDIGTAKPSKEERARVPHHLIDVVDPDEPFSAADFRTMAGAIISKLHKEGRAVFVVGGTGLYIKALTQGLFEIPEKESVIRQRLKTAAKELGLEAMYGRLKGVDPEGAAKIHPKDAYRVIRALEVFELTGKPISAHHRTHEFSDEPYRVLKIGLFMDREILYHRINERVDVMLSQGFVDEVKGLLDRGYGPDLKSMQSIGYRHVSDFLLGRVDWEETVRLFKRDTRRYAKRQFTWSRADQKIQWRQPEAIDFMEKEIEAFLTRAL